MADHNTTEYPLPEFAMVRALVGRGDVSAGTVGVIVDVHPGGVAYEVEMPHGQSAVVETYRRVELEVCEQPIRKKATPA